MDIAGDIHAVAWHPPNPSLCGAVPHTTVHTPHRLLLPSKPACLPAQILVCTPVRLHNPQLCMHTHTCTHALTHAHMHARAHTLTHAHTLIHARTHSSTARKFSHTQTRTITYARTYLPTHSHTQESITNKKGINYKTRQKEMDECKKNMCAPMHACTHAHSLTPSHVGMCTQGRRVHSPAPGGMLTKTTNARPSSTIASTHVGVWAWEWLNA